MPMSGTKKKRRKTRKELNRNVLLATKKRKKEVIVKRVLNNTLGYFFGYDEREDWSVYHKYYPSICGYMRHIRSDKRSYKATMVLGVCAFTEPIYKTDSEAYGLCARRLDAPKGECPYRDMYFAKANKDKIMVQNPPGYSWKTPSKIRVPWRGSVILLKAHYDNGMIGNLNILGYEDVQIIDDKVYRKVSPIPIKQQRGLRTHIFGLENGLLETGAFWDREYVFGNKENFRKNIRFAKSYRE